MKKLSFFAVVSAVIFLFPSCSKDKTTTSGNAKVKTYTETISSSYGSTSTTFNIGYDSNDRIISVTSATSADNKFLFTYQSNMYSMDLYNLGALNIHEVFYLKNSLLDSTYQYNDTEDTTTEKYVYNSQNQLITTREYEYDNGPVLTNTITYTYDSNGNLVRSAGTDNKVETFDYYSDLVYALPLIAPDMLGSGKRNLEKTHVVTSNGYEVGRTTSTYTFDASGRISTITKTLTDGTFGMQTFTYF